MLRSAQHHFDESEPSDQQPLSPSGLSLSTTQSKGNKIAFVNVDRRLFKSGEYCLMYGSQLSPIYSEMALGNADLTVQQFGPHAQQT
jgi:hypothetical protein